jgi:hypothetical protein
MQQSEQEAVVRAIFFAQAAPKELFNQNLLGRLGSDGPRNQGFSEIKAKKQRVE